MIVFQEDKNSYCFVLEEYWVLLQDYDKLGRDGIPGATFKSLVTLIEVSESSWGWAAKKN
jgi:hypothetical protein